MTDDRLGILAHELRSPVAALAALAEGARGAGLDPETLGRMLALALAAGRDVERLLLDVEPSSVRPAAIDLVELLRAAARPGVVVVVVATGPLIVTGDPTRLRQAIGNLVANGLRHGSRVTIDVGADGGAAVIVVRDDGPGVDPEIDPFGRGVSAAGSTGYGLWLVRAIAEAHGGAVELVSAPGEGAAFRLSLPLSSGESE